MSLPPPVKYRLTNRISEEAKPAPVNDAKLLAQAMIDLSRANLPVEFLAKYPVLDEEAVHSQAGYEDEDKAGTAENWRSAGRIIGLPVCGVTVYPAFQFQPDGLPYPLLQEVLQAIPEEYSDWIRVFWLVSPNEWRGRKFPIAVIQEGNPKVVKAVSVAWKVLA